MAEDFFLHYEHVAERTLVAVQYGVCILPVVRVILAKDLIHEAEVADSQVIVACIMLDQRMIPPHGFNIVDGRGNDIPSDHLALDGFIIQAIPPCSGLVDEVVHDFAIVVGLVGYVAEIEVATVVTESVVIGIDVFPSPILRSELAIHGIERRNRVPAVVMKHMRELFRCLRCSDLQETDRIALRDCNACTGGYIDFYTLPVLPVLVIHAE